MIEQHPPNVPIERTGPIGRVLSVGGHPVTSPRHSGATWVHTRTSPDSAYERRRRRHEFAAQCRAHPDFHVIGRAVPYDKVLPSDRGERLVFSAATEWALDARWIGLQLEHHGAFLGVAKVIEHDAGLYVDGNVLAPRVKALDGRHELSVGISNMTTRSTRSGVLEVISARLDEVSLVRHARWAPWTDAAVVPIA